MEEKNLEEETKEDVEKFLALAGRIGIKLLPVQKPLIYVCVIILLLFVSFVGFAAGAFRVCSQVEGFLDNRFSCHLDYSAAGYPKNYTPMKDLIDSDSYKNFVELYGEAWRD